MGCAERSSKSGNLLTVGIRHRRRLILSTQLCHLAGDAQRRVAGSPREADDQGDWETASLRDGLAAQGCILRQSSYLSRPPFSCVFGGPLSEPQLNAEFLLTEPIVTALSTWIGFAWACLFLGLTSVGLVFRGYGFNDGQAGTMQL